MNMQLQVFGCAPLLCWLWSIFSGLSGPLCRALFRPAFCLPLKIAPAQRYPIGSSTKSAYVNASGGFFCPFSRLRGVCRVCDCDTTVHEGWHPLRILTLNPIISLNALLRFTFLGASIRTFERCKRRTNVSQVEGRYQMKVYRQFLVSKADFGSPFSSQN